MKEPLKAYENIKREAGTPYFSTLYDIDMWREDLSIVEQALQDFQWLKAHICWDLLDHLNTEDKLKLLEIMGVNYD